MTKKLKSNNQNQQSTRRHQQHGGGSCHIIQNKRSIQSRSPREYKDLRVKYGFGRAETLGDRYNRNIIYHCGAETALGPIEWEEWTRLAKSLIHEKGDDQLFEQLTIWEREHNFCVMRKDEFEQHCLTLHMAEIFDNPEWINYVPFSQKYRPEKLRDANLVWISCDCCNTPGQITEELLTTHPGTAPCPKCGRWIEYQVITADYLTKTD